MIDGDVSLPMPDDPSDTATLDVERTFPRAVSTVTFAASGAADGEEPVIGRGRRSRLQLDAILGEAVHAEHCDNDQSLEVLDEGPGRRDESEVDEPQIGRGRRSRRQLGGGREDAEQSDQASDVDQASRTPSRADVGTHSGATSASGSHSKPRRSLRRLDTLLDEHMASAHETAETSDVYGEMYQHSISIDAVNDPPAQEWIVPDAAGDPPAKASIRDVLLRVCIRCQHRVCSSEVNE